MALICRIDWKFFSPFMIICLVICDKLAVICSNTINYKYFITNDRHIITNGTHVPHMADKLL